MRTVKFKHGVKLAGLQPEMLHAIDVCADVFDRDSLTVTITSARDGRHGHHSHHYKGLAIDIRVWEIPGKVNFYCEKFREALGPEYQVINEQDHIHIEYDPA